MANDPTADQATTTTLDNLTPHPNNPRLGSVDDIMVSLRTFGQYRPLVANRRTNHILKGNHTFKAMTRLGWTEAKVAWIDVDTDTENRILLADNKTAMRGGYDDDVLMDLLADVDLVGTGYDDRFLAQLEVVDEDPFAEEIKLKGASTERAARRRATFGHLRVQIETAYFDEWVSRRLAEAGSHEDLVSALRSELDLPPEPPPAPRAKKRLKTKSFPDTAAFHDLGVVDEPIDSLTPHPDNPRRGDVSAIAASIRKHGIYTPIIVNQDGVILAGNHTWQAAKSVGVDAIPVWRIEADEATSRRILLADNRLSDLGVLDLSVVVDMLTEFDDDVTGLGFDPAEVNEIIGDGATGSITPHQTAPFRIGKVRLGNVGLDAYATWLAAIQQKVGFELNDYLTWCFSAVGLSTDKVVASARNNVSVQ